MEIKFTNQKEKQKLIRKMIKVIMDTIILIIIIETMDIRYDNKSVYKVRTQQTINDDYHQQNDEIMIMK